MKRHKEDTGKLEFKKKEFLTLLQVFEIADWVLNSYSNEEADGEGEFNKLMQMVCAHAKENGCSSLVGYDPDHQEYLFSKKYEDTCSMMDLIEKFENETFWDELLERLSERDAIREKGAASFRTLDANERIAKIEEHKKRYLEEFEKNGIERLIVP